MNHVQKVVVILATVMIGISPTYAAQNCEIKKQELSNQLRYAEKYASSYRVAGLKRAIQNVDRYCQDDTPTQIKMQLQTEHKIEKQKAELYKAQQNQDTQKALKKQQELNQALFELEQIQTTS